eukprot:scaffold96801_cov54-Phaeocystis_antarctica.AAC.1
MALRSPPCVGLFRILDGPRPIGQAGWHFAEAAWGSVRDWDREETPGAHAPERQPRPLDLALARRHTLQPPIVFPFRSRPHSHPAVAAPRES